MSSLHPMMAFNVSSMPFWSSVSGGKATFYGTGAGTGAATGAVVELRLVVILRCYQPLVQQQVLVLVPEQPLVVLALV